MNPQITALLALIACTALLFPSDGKAAVPTNGQVIITEFRVRGPNGGNDEFVEIYNNTVSNMTVATLDGSSGWAVAASDGRTRFIVPNGTILPARGHFLGINSVGYSIGGYPAGNGATAAGDASYTLDIPDNAGIALFRTANTNNFVSSNRLDAVGSTSEANTLYKEGTGYPAISPFSIDCSFYRNLTNGAPRDTGNNSADFLFVDSNGTSAGAGQRLGAPGPEALSSPMRLPGGTNGLIFSLIDTNAGPFEPPNYVRNFTSVPANDATFGTILIRRRVRNNTTNTITRLRFRITDVTTFPAPPGIADLRPQTVTNQVVITSGGNVAVAGTVLEQPPTQPNGGGFNSTLSADVISLVNPILPGGFTTVQFLFGLQQEGQVRVRLLTETLPAATNDILVVEGIDDEGVENTDPRIWTGLGADNFWTTPANWLSNVVPVAGCPLVFPAGAARLVNSNNLTGGTLFSSITFTGASGGYDLRGNSITLGSGGIPAVNTSGTNVISLPISISNQRTINVSPATLVISNAVSGAGGLNKSGTGTLVLAGTTANTFGGNLWVIAGVAILSKTSGVNALGGTLIVGSAGGPDILRLGSANQIPDSSGIILTGGLLDLNGFNETLGSVAMTGARLVSGPPGSGNTVYLEGNITTVASAQSSRLEGAYILTGGATRGFSVSDGEAEDDLIVLSPLGSAGGTGLTKNGAGRMVIETNCTYRGDTTVSSGTLIMNGANSETAVVLDGGVFGGDASVGTISGSDGILSPGQSPGTVTATNLQLLAGSTLAAEIYGTGIGTEFDRVNVNGPVTLGGNLSVTLGAGASQVGNIFRLINNDGADAISGTFAGRAEGSTMIIGGYRFRVSYVGGTGNDFTLTRLPHLNITSNNIPGLGQASVYPSTITLAGITGLVSRVTVTLSNFSHTFPGDVDVLLVSPTGKKVLLMSDCGSTFDVTNVDLTISDSAVTNLPDAGQIVSGSFRPSNYQIGDPFAPPAPNAPYLANMSVFIGDSPNGIWSLYVMDDAANDTGSFAGGWSLDVTVGPPLDITRISGNRAVLSWPDYAVGFELETTSSLTNTAWFPLAATPIASDGQYRVTNSIGPTNLFYRLVK